MKKLFSIAFLIIACLIFGLGAVRAQQVSQFSQPTQFTTAVTNSPILASAIANIPMPSIPLSITVTNPLAIITNSFNLTNTLIVQRTFIFNAATMGTNFSTNFPAFSLPVTNSIYGQALQSSGLTNGATIQ